MKRKPFFRKDVVAIMNKKEYKEDKSRDWYFYKTHTNGYNWYYHREEGGGTLWISIFHDAII